MSNEELMRPRYKVIAIDTTESFQIGDILNHPPEWHDYIWVTPTGKCIFYPEKYPHLFKKLEWWEERKIEDMPEYLNCPSRKMFFRVERWHKSYFIIDGKQKMQYRNYIPATAAEYEQYINQKEKQ